MIKAVLFDLDGTLVNSLEDLAEASNRALAEMGFPIHGTEEYKYFVGDGIPKLIERILPSSQRTEENKSKCIELFFDYYSKHFADNTKAYDGMPMLVEGLKQRGIKMAVVSNKAQEMTDLVVSKLYGNVFDLVIGKRKNVPAKPNPMPLMLAAGELGVECEECVFLGDSGMDMRAAFGAQMMPIGVLWGFRTEEELLKNGAKYTVSQPQDIYRMLLEF